MRVQFLLKALISVSTILSMDIPSSVRTRIEEITKEIRSIEHEMLKAEQTIADCEESIEAEEIRIAKFRMELAKLS